MVTVSFFVFAATYMITTPGNLIQVGAADLQCSTSCQEELQCQTPTPSTQLQAAVELSSHSPWQSLPLLVTLGVKNYTQYCWKENNFNTRNRYFWLAFYSWQVLMTTWIWPRLHSSSQTWRLSSICHTCEKLCFLYPNIPFSTWLQETLGDAKFQMESKQEQAGIENFLLWASQNNETPWLNIFKALCSVPILNNVPKSAIKSCKLIFSLARACAKHLLLHLFLLRNIKTTESWWEEIGV